MFSPQQAPYTLAAAAFMTAQPILTAFSRNEGGSYSYSAGSTLVLSELLKLIISSVLLTVQLLRAPKDSVKVLDDRPLLEMSLYSIPSFVYFVTNNLQFIILQAISPTTAQLLAQLKTVFTGILFRVMLKRRMTAFQWLALLTLACGTACSQIPSAIKSQFLVLTDAVNQLNHPVNWLNVDRAGSGWVAVGNAASGAQSLSHATSFFTFAPSQYAVIGLLASVVAALLSSLAGVYNELLMKGRSSAPIHFQNIMMYTWGVLMNTIYMFVVDGTLVREHGMLAGYDGRTWLVVLANALTGLVISGVLKFCDNIARVYASAIAMMITLFISVPLFHSPITPQIIIAFFLVVISTLQFNISDEVADKFDRPAGYGEEKKDDDTRKPDDAKV